MTLTDPKTQTMWWLHKTSIYSPSSGSSFQFYSPLSNTVYPHVSLPISFILLIPTEPMVQYIVQLKVLYFMIMLKWCHSTKLYFEFLPFLGFVIYSLIFLLWWAVTVCYSQLCHQYSTMSVLLYWDVHCKGCVLNVSLNLW